MKMLLRALCISSISIIWNNISLLHNTSVLSSTRILSTVVSNQVFLKLWHLLLLEQQICSPLLIMHFGTLQTVRHNIGTPPHESTLKSSQQHARVTSCVNICVRMLEALTPAEGSMTPLNTHTGAPIFTCSEGGPWQCSSLDQARLETGSHSPPLLVELCVQAFRSLQRKACLCSSHWGTCSPGCYHGQKKREGWAEILWEAHIPPRLHFRTCGPAWLRAHCSMLACYHGNALQMGVGVWVTWSPKG